MLATTFDELLLSAEKPDYRDLGADYFEKRQQDVIVKQSVHRLENLGFTVTIAAPDAS